MIKTVVLLSCLNILSGCKAAPVPPEVIKTEIQEHDLWKSGADIYTPEEYKNYKLTFRIAKDHLIRENTKFAWFRDYKTVQKEFIDVIEQGDHLLKKIQEQKQTKANNIANQITFFRNRVETLKKLSTFINEGSLSRRHLTKAELLLSEAQLLIKREQYMKAEETLKDIPKYTTIAIGAILPILSRYADKPQITKWRTWVNETIKTSKQKGIYSIVVSKLDKKLILYNNGKPYRTYTVELGKNGFKDKLLAGDSATPEGKYHITKKLPRSRFYKALLINYPNDDDWRQFAIAKRKRLIRSNAGIGELIEIHGGGKEGMTRGCIAMGNNHIDELFELVDTGTPVTIVGAIEYKNNISRIIK